LVKQSTLVNMAFKNWSWNTFSVGIVKRIRGGWARNSRFDSQQGSVQTGLVVHCPSGVRQQRYEADHLFGPIAEVDWSYTDYFPFPISHHGMHRDNFTLFYPLDRRLYGHYSKFRRAFIGNQSRLSGELPGYPTGYISSYTNGKMSFSARAQWPYENWGKDFPGNVTTA